MTEPVKTDQAEPPPLRQAGRLVEVAALFLRLGATAFGGPAAHVALIDRECVERRRWITREAFLDVLGMSNLIPGPTSTELAMHVGRLRAGWPGLIAAGIAFILPAAVMVGLLAAVYVRTGDVPMARGILLAVQPAVVVVVAQAIVPLGRAAVRSPSLVLLALFSAVAAIAGVDEISVLIGAGLVRLASARVAILATLAVATTVGAVSAQEPVRAAAIDVAAYFLRVGSLLFGSGYVLLPILQDDLVVRRAWLSEGELLDAIAAGQSTPGPVFTTATFIGYVLGGPQMAVVATVAMFLPAFVCAAASALVMDRVRHSPRARRFLDGVNAAAVALIAVVLITLGRIAFAHTLGMAVGAIAAVALLARVPSTIVLLGAAIVGALSVYIST